MIHIANKLQDLKTVWKQNTSIRFLTWVVVSYFVWNFLYTFWFTHSSLTALLTVHLAEVTTSIVSYMGMEATLVDTTIFVDSNRTLFVGNACNGAEFFGIFTCFVLVYPISFKFKWWFVLLGVLCIHILNLIRLVLLVIIYSNYPGHFDFNHKYTFVLIIYGALFFMWFAWAKKYRQLP